MKTTVRHLEALNYTLVASVPSHMLMPCSRMLPRPPWEIYMYWGLNIFMVIILEIYAKLTLNHFKSVVTHQITFGIFFNSICSERFAA